MYAVKVYIKPEDILNRLPEIEQKVFNTCIFTDVKRDSHEGIQIECLLYNCEDDMKVAEHRYRLFQEAEEVDK